MGIVASLLLVAVAPAFASSNDPGTSSPESGDVITPVIGGTAVPAGKWPDAVAVLGQGSCTGTLIAPDVVLTAGHCVDAGMTEVVANTLDYAGQGGTRSTIKSITAYPNWETSYDVAVIVLNTPITGVTPRKVGTACTFTEGFQQSTMVHLVGFGLTDTAGQGNNTRLNEAMAPVTNPTCTDMGAGCVASVSPGGEFIAGGGGKDSCFGDSGGPVYLDTPRGPVVVGAVSRGLDGAATPCGGGGIYVRTDKVIEWIESTAGKPVEKDLCVSGPGGEDPGEDPGEEPGGNNPDGPSGPGGNSGDISGGCSSTGGSGAGLAFLGLAFAFRRRKTRR